jgi:thioredoxin reductase (NADPH)
VLDELLDEWEAGYIPPFDGIRVVGHSFSPKAHEIKSFLSGNLFPYRWFDALKEPEGRELFELHGATESDLPLVVLDAGGILRNPTVLELAQKLGLQPKPGHSTYDVAIIGAGPAGLAAAVYGASEGLETVLIEKKAPGGQAGTSSRIENYLGFPTGLSGSELSRRAVAQATRFGVELMSPNSVRALERQGEYHRLLLEDGSELNAKSIVIASGVDYRKLEAEGLERFLGAGVYYGAANTEAASCADQDVYVVGGGNSAGQAAVYLSNFARKVGIVVRKPDLSSTMSAYLIKQIEELPNIELVPFTEVSRGEGGERLEKIELANRADGSSTWVEAAGLFVFIGAKPYTDWLPKEIEKDPRGFVYTGRDLVQKPEFKLFWKQSREPYLLETSIPGVFAAGDVRSGAMNRVASAVGEGSMSIAMVHQYLAQF